MGQERVIFPLGANSLPTHFLCGDRLHDPPGSSCSSPNPCSTRVHVTGLAQTSEFVCKAKTPKLGMDPGLRTRLSPEVSVWVGRKVAVRNSSRMTKEGSAYKGNFLPPTEWNNPYYLAIRPWHPQIYIFQMELFVSPIYFSAEAERCRPTSTLSDGQRVWRLTGIIAPPNSGGGCLALLKLR